MLNRLKPKRIYDPAEIAELAKTLTRKQIMERTGISRQHLSQMLIALGLGRRKAAPTDTKPKKVRK